MTSDNSELIKVGVCGAAGRMGKEVARAVLAEPNMKLVMAVDTNDAGKDIALAVNMTQECGVLIEENLLEAIKSKQPDVVVDFTSTEVVLNNTLTAIREGCRSVIGTTGLSMQNIGLIEIEANSQKSGVIIAPNFAIGAVLLMKFAQQASKYFDHAEIIEYHHNKKLDAPSGTAFKTADLMHQVQPKFGRTNLDEEEKEALLGCRGGKSEGNIRIHSIRLPGLVAHQEVVFGGVGQTLTIRHDSIDRTSFMPGVVFAIRKVMQLEGLIYGLENLM